MRLWAGVRTGADGAGRLVLPDEDENDEENQRDEQLEHQHELKGDEPHVKTILGSKSNLRSLCCTLTVGEPRTNRESNP